MFAPEMKAVDAQQQKDLRMIWVSISIFAGFCIGYATHAWQVWRERRPIDTSWGSQHEPVARGRRAF
ncbi:hypothetical protein XI06_21920 [Bradyrhizobium sp. CCBAU 11434]|nr:hypothetical protein [Bradyrhizobium sp. CCBAU 11434]